MNRRRTGTAYEQYAARYLQEKGYQILQRNFRCRQGEIDLIARDGAYLVFAEVKYRKDETMGSGAEAVNAAKQRRIVNCARYYLLCHPEYQEYPCRFDVVDICGTEIMLIRDAFWCEI